MYPHLVYKRVKLFFAIKYPTYLKAIRRFSAFSGVFMLRLCNLFKGSAAEKRPVRLTMTPYFCTLADDDISLFDELPSCIPSRVVITFLMVADLTSHFSHLGGGKDRDAIIY